jgi:hypothetical protein
MNKKHVFFAMVFFALVLAAVSAQDAAKMRQLEQELNQLSADFSAGKITTPQFQQRAQAIALEMQAAQSAQVQRIEQASSPYSLTDAQVRRLVELMDQGKSTQAQENEGRVTKAAAEQRYAQIQREIDQIYAPFTNLTPEQTANLARQQQDIETQVTKLWPNHIPGWPAAESYVRLMGLRSGLRQAANTRASWYGKQFHSPYTSTDGTRVVQIAQTGAGANQAALEDLRRQVEAATGKTMKRLADDGPLGATFAGTQNGYTLDYPYILFDDGSLHCFAHTVALANGTLYYYCSIFFDNVPPGTSVPGAVRVKD